MVRTHWGLLIAMKSYVNPLRILANSEETLGDPWGAPGGPLQIVANSEETLGGPWGTLQITRKLLGPLQIATDIAANS
jgi:hypothetical protein